MVSYRFLKKTDRKLFPGLVELYKSQGWWHRGDDEALLAAMMEGSHCFVAALDGREIVGMGRAISDRANDAYIQDMVVSKSRRGSGIGRMIINKLVLKLKKDGIKWVGLISVNGTRRFYERSGFEKMKRAHPMLMKKSR